MLQIHSIWGLLLEVWIDGRLVLRQWVARAVLSLFWFSLFFPPSWQIFWIWLLTRADRWWKHFPGDVSGATPPSSLFESVRPPDPDSRRRFLLCARWGDHLLQEQCLCPPPWAVAGQRGAPSRWWGVADGAHSLFFSILGVVSIKFYTVGSKKLRGASGGQGKAVLWKAKESHPQADLSVLLSVGRLVVLLLSLLVQHGFTWFSKSFCTVRSCHLRTVTSVARSCPWIVQEIQVSSCNCHCCSGLGNHW